MSDGNRSTWSTFWHFHTALQYRHRLHLAHRRQSVTREHGRYNALKMVTGAEQSVLAFVSRKGSYTRVERRCLGLYHSLSIINKYNHAIDERNKNVVPRRLRTMDKEIRFPQQAKHSRISHTYECTFTYVISDWVCEISSVTTVRMIMNHRECLLTIHAYRGA